MFEQYAYDETKYLVIATADDQIHPCSTKKQVKELVSKLNDTYEGAIPSRIIVYELSQVKEVY